MFLMLIFFCVGWHSCRYCLGTVLNTFAYEEEKQMRLQCQSMLAVAKNIFSHLGESQLISYMRYSLSWTSEYIHFETVNLVTLVSCGIENQI